MPPSGCSPTAAPSSARSAARARQPWPEPAGAQRQARVCVAVTTVIGLAGLGDDPALRPTSLTAHAGRSVFDRTGRVEEAARLLGLRSLDRAAALIGYDWSADR